MRRKILLRAIAKLMDSRRTHTHDEMARFNRIMEALINL